MSNGENNSNARSQNQGQSAAGGSASGSGSASTASASTAQRRSRNAASQEILDASSDEQGMHINFKISSCLASLRLVSQ